MVFIFHLSMDFRIFWLDLHLLLLKRNPLVPCLQNLELVLLRILVLAYFVKEKVKRKNEAATKS